MSARNCRRVKADGVVTTLGSGWVGRSAGGLLYFRPTRGSDGFALYETKEAALRFTGCPEAIPVRIEMISEEGRDT